MTPSRPPSVRMIMNKITKIPYHIARRVGDQGAPCPVSDQAGHGNYATGKNHIQLRNLLKLGTWNVRKLKEIGKLHAICNEMDRYNLQILGICETNWNGKGSFTTVSQHSVLFSGKEDGYSHGIAVILSKETKKTLIGYSPINDRILKVRLQAKPYNVSIIQCYAPTTAASDEEMKDFYNTLQETMDTIPHRDVKIVMGDFNAKVGLQNNTNPICGRYGLGQQNESGEDLIEFCGSNNLTITNTMFKHHPRHLYTWTSPDMKTRNQIDYILFSQQWKSNVKNVRTRPGADCNSDHQLLTADVKFKLKKMKQPPHPIRLDYKTLNDEYRVRVTNRFEALQWRIQTGAKGA